LPYFHTCSTLKFVNRNHKFSVKTLKSQICGDLKSPVTEAWINLDLLSLDLGPSTGSTSLACNPRTCTMGTLSTISSPLLPSRTRTVRSSWTTASPYFAVVWMQPPTLPSVCALSLTCLPPPYPSNQLWLSTSGMRETSMTTGLLPALPRLMTLNCKQLWMGCVRPTMSVWRTYAKCTSSLTPQTCSISPWIHLITLFFSFFLF
jgi:hypothetical protein